MFAARVLGLCSTDARVVDYLNDAQQRLLWEGTWWGCYQKYKVCVTGGCLTWPRHIAAIEAVAVSDSPITVRNEWFEFLETGTGLKDGTHGRIELFDRGTACTFNDLAGTNKRIRVVADVAESATARILLLGYDQNSDWLRTQDAGIWIDGEYVAINVAGTLSANRFTVLSDVIKPITNGVVRLYEYNNDTALVSNTLAYYDPDEETPRYRRSLIPNLPLTNTDGTETVDIMAKLDYYAARNDNDFLVISNRHALSHAVRALRYWELDAAGANEQGAQHWQLALLALDKELRHHLGSGTVAPLRVAEEFAAGAVETIV